MQLDLAVDAARAELDRAAAVRAGRYRPCSPAPARSQAVGRRPAGAGSLGGDRNRPAGDCDAPSRTAARARRRREGTSIETALTGSRPWSDRARDQQVLGELAEAVGLLDGGAQGRGSAPRASAPGATRAPARWVRIASGVRSSWLASATNVRSPAKCVLQAREHRVEGVAEAWRSRRAGGGHGQTMAGLGRQRSRRHGERIDSTGLSAAAAGARTRRARQALGDGAADEQLRQKVAQGVGLVLCRCAHDHDELLVLRAYRSRQQSGVPMREQRRRTPSARHLDGAERRGAATCGVESTMCRGRSRICANPSPCSPSGLRPASASPWSACLMSAVMSLARERRFRSTPRSSSEPTRR